MYREEALRGRPEVFVHKNSGLLVQAVTGPRVRMLHTELCTVCASLAGQAYVLIVCKHWMRWWIRLEAPPMTPGGILKNLVKEAKSVKAKAAAVSAALARAALSS
jgi:hypothetical protein